MVAAKFKDVYLAEVVAVKPLHDFVAQLTFSNGVEREVDLELHLHGGIFEEIRNAPALYRAIRIADGTVSWPNGADIDPDTLYYDGEPPWIAKSKPTRSARKRAVRKPTKQRAARGRAKIPA